MPNTREKLIKIVKDTNTELERRHYMVVSIADRIIASGFIEELQNEGYDMGVDSALHNHFGLSWEDAAGLRKEIKRLQEAARWIPVTERLPKKNEMVFVYCKDKTIRGLDVRHIGSCDNGFWFLKTQPGTASFPHPEWEVTHWMPLPHPPKA